MPLLVSLTSQRATYFALELDGSWTENLGSIERMRSKQDRNAAWRVLREAPSHWPAIRLAPQARLARTMVCTSECMAVGWLAKRRLSPASK